MRNSIPICEHIVERWVIVRDAVGRIVREGVGPSYCPNYCGVVLPPGDDRANRPHGASAARD